MQFNSLIWPPDLILKENLVKVLVGVLTESRGSVQGADSKNHYFNFIVLLYTIHKINPCYITVATEGNQHSEF